MLPELGHFALILALCVSILLSVVPLYGSLRGNDLLAGYSIPLSIALFALSATSFACLVGAFLQDDFSVSYVAANSNSLLPWYYKFSATWGAHEGSMLLWVLVQAGWTAAVAVRTNQLPADFRATVLAVMGLLSVGFILFVLFTSNPFERLFPFPPVDGNDLNPLLQDFGLIIHPPMLYMGYVGLSVAFSFALAALIGERLDKQSIQAMRPWTNVAWAFLTVGIALGSWWAYYELGWGGWWFWDPVENASLMPWLIGTALVHSQAVAEKRGHFKRWTLLLSILAFSLSLLGTFLVRSGVLVSVHAFASDPERGMFILAFLVLVIGGSLLVYALKVRDIAVANDFSLLSRDFALLWNNIFFVLMASVVLVGTLFPLAADFWNGSSVSIGPPYFNKFLVLFMVPVLVLLAPGSVMRWRNTSKDWLWHRVRWPAVAAIAGGALVPLLYTEYSIAIAIASILALWIALVTLDDIIRRVRFKKQHAEREVFSFGYSGMVTAHLGVAVLVVGAVFATVLTEDRDVRLEAGDQFDLGGYHFEAKEYKTVNGPNYIATQGDVVVTKNGQFVTELYPQKRRYMATGAVMTEAGIDGNMMRDVYVSLGEEVAPNAWAVRLHVKPFVRWIWWGCGLIALGAVLAIFDRRYRSKEQAAV